MMVFTAHRTFLSNHTGKNVIMLAKNLSNYIDHAIDTAIDRTIDTLALDLERLDIAYAIVGGNALKVHGFKRLTTDVDVLLSKGGKEFFSRELVGRGYSPRFTSAKTKFKNTVYSINIDLLESGEYPGDGKPKEVSFPDPKKHSFDVISPSGVKVKYLKLSSIIELKLASYLSLPNGRERDKLDVIELVKVACLDDKFSMKLHHCVRNIYIECFQRAMKELEDDLKDN